MYIAQTILALPYIVALTPAAIQGLPPGLLAQARALGAGRLQLSALALREAKIGVFAAVIAALGSALSEVGAVMIVGGNIENHDQTLASATLQQVNDYSTTPTRSRSDSSCSPDRAAHGHPDGAPAADERHPPAVPAGD